MSHRHAPIDRPTVRPMADRISLGQPPPDTRSQSDSSTTQSSTTSTGRGSSIKKARESIPSHGHDPTPDAIRLTASVAAAYEKMRGQSQGNPGPLWQSIMSFEIPNYQRQPYRPKEWRPYSPNLPDLNPLEYQEREINMVPDGIGLLYNHAAAPSKPLRPLDLSFTAAEARDFAREQDDTPDPSTTEHRTKLVPGEDKAYEKYGYLHVNGTWADPDSEEQVLDAVHGRRSANRPFLPTPVRGPRILSKEEEEREFRLLEEYVSDEEGECTDPQRTDITPYLFLCWAGESRRRPGFIEVEETAQPIQRPRRSKYQEPKIPSRVYPQFDEETGSQLSGVYEIDSNPSPLWSPQGVDVLNRPPTFSRNNPQANLNIERTAYGKSENTPHYLSQEYADDLEMDDRIDDIMGVRALTNDGNYFHGQLNFMRWQAEMNTLYASRNLAMSRYTNEMEDLHFLRNRRAHLDKQTFFLKKRLREQKTEDRHRAIQKAAKEEQRFRELLQERRERVSLDTEWANAMTGRIRTKTDKLMAEVQEKEQERAGLLSRLGVDRVSEIEDLYPSAPSSSDG